MADGTIIIDTELKTDKLKNKLDKLNNDIERQTGKVKNLQAEYDKLLSGEGAPAVNPAVEKLSKQLDKARTDLEAYNAELEKIHQGTDIQLQAAETPEMVERILEVEQIQVDALNEKYGKQIATVQRLENEISNIPQETTDTAAEAEKLRLQLEQAQIALERMETDARGVENQIEQVQQPTSQVQQHLDAAQNSLGKFEKRLQTIAKKVFIFSLLTAALRSVKGYMSEALAANESFQNSLANLKGTLRTAFQPILDFIIPILQALINVLNAAIGYVAKFTSWLFGSTVQASSAAAKALYDQTNATKAAGAAAVKAKRQMSGLDEMNTWQNDTSSGGGGAAEPAIKFDGIKKAMGELEVYISGALLAIGAILAFTGVSIPLGIALMAIGAAGLASAMDCDWNSMPDNIRSALTIVLGILGGAALVIGAILTFSGVNLPLGIGLMIAGAAMLGTAAALNWDKITQFISGDVAVLMSICGAALLALGLILVASGAGLPLGIALIAIGALAFATPIALNWDALLTKIKSTWEKIKRWWTQSVAPKFTLKFWKQKFSSIAEGLTSKIKDGINAAIALFNRFVNWINGKMNIKWNAVKIAGLEVIPKGSFQLLKLNNIPQLAKGAVIPANREFMAVLGDQKNGRNLEAPEDLIRQIVREESGNGQYTFIAQLDGRTIFKEVIDQGKLSRRMTGKNAFALGGRLNGYN